MTSRRVLARLLVLGACWPLLGGCTLLRPHFVSPQLSLERVELAGGDLMHQRLRVRLHVHNPNDRELPVKGLSYTLYVAGESVATGESAASFTVPALGDAEFDMNVLANAAGAVWRILTHPGAADLIQYRIVGHVELASGLLRSLPFERSGTFSLR